MQSRVVLKLKIADADADRLEHLGVLCRLARNVGAEDWILRARGLIEESEKQSGAGRNGGEKSESTKIYHAITAKVPQLDTQVVAKIAGQLASNIRAKLDWRRRGDEEDGKPLYRWQAILEYDDRPPFATTLNVEMPSKNVTANFTDRLRVSAKIEKGVSDRFEIATEKLKPGQRQLIRRCLTGDLKLADSYLVFKDNKWYWYLPIAMTEEPVDSDLTAYLRPWIPDGTNRDRPFELRLPERTWNVGDGRYYKYQTDRLNKLIGMIGKRYRDGSGAGHGRQKVDRAVSRRRLQLRNLADEVRRRIIADIVKQCKRDRCGTLVYFEPTNPVKDLCWFSVVNCEEGAGVAWDWTRFVSDLKNALAKPSVGITLSKKKLKMKDVENEKEVKGEKAAV